MAEKTYPVPLTPPDHVERALAWILAEEIDIAEERADGLSRSDAAAEARDLGISTRFLIQLVEARRMGDGMAGMIELGRDLAWAALLDRRVKLMAAKAKDAPDPDEIRRLRLEVAAVRDYHAVAGRVVRLAEVECYDEQNCSATAVCDPPVLARIAPYLAIGGIEESVTRWTDDDNCDPYWNVDILEPHPAFEGLRPSWVFGTCRALSNRVEPAALIDVDEETEARMKEIPPVRDFYVPADDSVSAGPGMR